MIKKATIIILRLFLGVMILKGGVNKFTKEIPTAHEVVEKAQKFDEPEKEGTLKKILYISGMKQTGYMWPLLGFFEVALGLLLILQKPASIAALLMLPITLQIFCFHLFLEPEDTWELFLTSLYFIINISLVLIDFKLWKPLLWRTR